MVRNARGKPTEHHMTYELTLADGTVLRSRISRPANTDTYGPSLWGHILGAEQLAVTEDEFWDCGDNGRLPDRSRFGPAAPPTALPASLVYQLVHTLGLGAAEVEGMTQEEAVRRLQAHWAQPR